MNGHWKEKATYYLNLDRFLSGVIRVVGGRMFRVDSQLYMAVFHLNNAVPISVDSGYLNGFFFLTHDGIRPAETK